jgi:hypothetical protein
MKNILLSVLLAFVFNSCSTPASKVTSDYFSISGFLSAEENLLKEEKAWLLKEVTYEGKKEVQSIHHPDWKQELKPFLESAIDKPSTINAYSIDTITEPGTVIYLAKEKKVPVKRMAISYADNKPQTIHIEFEKSNSWFLHNQNLTFTSGKGFQIDGEQKMALGKTTKYSITCRFMK